MLASRRILSIFLAAFITSAAAAQGVGYDDGPMLPHQPWRVHDINRPNPPIVDPGPAPETPAPAPSDAIVLLDGSNLDAWQHAKARTAEWDLLDNGVMQVKPGSGDLYTRQNFGDVQLHIEWATPDKVEGESQHRGNSGVFFFGRYEIQILDSYDNKTYADGQAAALYGQHPPLVNASRGPGQWQTYDIVFEAPRFDDQGNLEKPAYVTVFHNGVLVQNHRALLGATQHRALAHYAAHEPTGPIKLQDHGNTMRFRNIWVRPLNLDDEKPVKPVQPR
jgi:3-keto-disaccharide hydrolase